MEAARSLCGVTMQELAPAFPGCSGAVELAVN